MAGEDIYGGGGKPIPDGEYLVDVLDASVEESDNGTRVVRQYGNVRTKDGQTEFQLPDGAMYRIGERKLFARSWWVHSNEMAQQIGRRELAQESIAAGLAAKPAKGEKFVMPYDDAAQYAEAIRGANFVVRTRQKVRTKKLSDGTKVEVMDDETGLPVIDVNVVSWKAI